MFVRDDAGMVLELNIPTENLETLPKGDRE